MTGTPSHFFSAKAPLYSGSKLDFVSREVSREKRVLSVAVSHWRHVRGEEGAFPLPLFPRSPAQFTQQKLQPRACLKFLIGTLASIQFEKLLISGSGVGFPP
jgi:hypothetical protein